MASEAKWTAVDEGDGNFVIRAMQGPIEVQIARVFDPNAVSLISAAPKLYAALESSLHAIQYMMPAFENDMFAAKIEATRSAARAALSKASTS